MIPEPVVEPNPEKPVEPVPNVGAAVVVVPVPNENPPVLDADGAPKLNPVAAVVVGFATPKENPVLLPVPEVVDGNPNVKPVLWGNDV